MPKVFLTAQARKDDETARKNSGITYAIAGSMKVRNMTMRDLAAMVGLSAATISRRIQHPEELTLCELRRISDALGIREDVARCL